MTNKNVLVTGGTGFIGFNLVKKLLKEGYNVTVLDNNSRGNIEKLNDYKKEINFVDCDIRDFDKVKNSTKNINKVFHLAAINGTKNFYDNPADVIEVGVKGMINIIDSCIMNNVSEFYLASTSEVYNLPPKIPTDENVRMIIPDVHNPRYSYSSSKIISEMYLLNFGHKYFNKSIIFRPHNVFGPDMGNDHIIPEIINKINYCKKLNNNALPIQGNGSETRSFIYIDDFIHALSLIIKKGKNKNIYNIGNDDEIKILDVIKDIITLSKQKLNINFTNNIEGSTPRRCPDISKIKNLGYKRSFKFLDSLKITYDSYL